jgi:Ca2+-binding RTX toxin-like protein
MPTVIDQLSQVAVISTFGEGAVEYFAQTFRAAGSALNSVEFLIDTGVPGDATEFRLLITTVSVGGGQFDPGTVLFESSLLVDPADAGDSYALVKVDTSKLALTPGATYAFILDAFVGLDGVSSSASLGAIHQDALGTDYTDGFFAFYDASGGNRAAHFGADWSEESLGSDLAFRLVFSNPGVTVIGKGGNDRVDANHSVGNQPPPGALDDLIFGKKGDDKLSGLGGDDTVDGGKGEDKIKGGEGDDELIGGKGGDTIRGGPGLDTFIFNVSPKQPFDKIKGYSIVDDMMVLDNASYSLVEGPLASTAFVVGTKAADADDRIIYDSVSGKVRYDSDGSGKNEALVFVKIGKGLALTHDNILVV